MKRLLVCCMFLAPLLGGAAICSELEALIHDCNSCHGDGGVSKWSDVPTIAGIDEFVHAEALYIYRDEARPCAESKFRQGDTGRAATSMCAIAAALDDETIEALAGHFAKLPFVAAKQPFDAALAATGKAIHERDCARCHSDGGANPDDEASILAGQWMDYLRAAFAEYASGEREQLDKMKEKMDPLSAADTEALLHFYASQQ